ncbi:MAG: alpha/beta hydrolase [Caulobacteraceae bacterium]|nr:alpha/beta hydrolase [Caulobacteraceae bacterium]
MAGLTFAAPRLGPPDRRPRGVMGLFWASLESAASGRTEHRPVSADYPDTVVRRTHFTAGGGFPWRISALETPRATPAPWKIVVITGAPSWAEYWAPVMAALPQDREMIVVDRPGFAASEPAGCVPDIRQQARALAPLLKRAFGQRILLVGQSYGASIATLMAEAHPWRVDQLALVSSYLAEPGPTARWLLALGSRFQGVIPRDLRHAVMEVTGHGAHIGAVREALRRVRAPVHMLHGDADDFAPIEAARRLALETRSRSPIRFESVAGANHFLTDGPAQRMIDALESCIPPEPPPRAWKWPSLPAPRALPAPVAAAAPVAAS